jgi:sugar/nucleoside kinase (ribokinase family)
MPQFRPGAPPLLVVGSAARDIDPADPRGWRLGGTVMYASLTAAKLGVRVRTLVGTDEQAAGAHELELLRDVGAEVELVRLERGPIFDNRQTPNGRIQYGHQPSDPIPTSAVPERWRATPAVLLAPVAGELGAEWAGFTRDAFMALAWQGLLRQIVPGEPVRQLPLRRSPFIDRADLVMVASDDIATGDSPVASLLHVGGRLVITHGRLGAVALRRRDGGVAGRTVPAMRPRQIVDETGAGDVFLAALCAGRLFAGAEMWHEHEWRLLALATAAASVSVEGVGLEAVPDRAAVCEALFRLRAQG